MKQPYFYGLNKKIPSFLSSSTFSRFGGIRWTSAKDLNASNPFTLIILKNRILKSCGNPPYFTSSVGSQPSKGYEIVFCHRPVTSFRIL